MALKRRGYREVSYCDVWPGIDFKVHGNGRDLEQEFMVHRGADLTRIRMAYRGIEKSGVEADGSLEVERH